VPSDSSSIIWYDKNPNARPESLVRGDFCSEMMVDGCQLIRGKHLGTREKPAPEFRGNMILPAVNFTSDVLINWTTFFEQHEMLFKGSQRILICVQAVNQHYEREGTPLDFNELDDSMCTPLHIAILKGTIMFKTICKS